MLIIPPLAVAYSVAILHVLHAVCYVNAYMNDKWVKSKWLPTLHAIFMCTFHVWRFPLISRRVFGAIKDANTRLKAEKQKIGPLSYAVFALKTLMDHNSAPLEISHFKSFSMVCWEVMEPFSKHFRLWFIDNLIRSFKLSYSLEVQFSIKSLDKNALCTLHVEWNNNVEISVVPFKIDSAIKFYSNQIELNYFNFVDTIHLSLMLQFY